MKRVRPRIAALLLFGAAVPVLGQGDQRLRSVLYVPSSIYTLRVASGYVATVILSPDERIQSIAVGNNAAWDVAASKSGDHLFIKPIGSGAPTNVEVVTDSRHYTLLLQSTSEGDPEAVLQLRFDYGAAAMAQGPAAGPGAMHAGPGDMAMAVSLPGRYRLSGSRVARPTSVLDDGQRTRFAFADDATLLAIYAVDEQGHEILVTAHRIGAVWIVDRIWRRYVFRLGTSMAEAERIKAPRP